MGHTPNSQPAMAASKSALDHLSATSPAAEPLPSPVLGIPALVADAALGVLLHKLDPASPKLAKLELLHNNEQTTS
jgi:hypothetical protein